MRILAITVAILSLTVVAIAQQPSPPSRPGSVAPEQPISLRPADLVWVDVPGLPQGSKRTVVRGDAARGPFEAFVRFPDGSELAPHWHTANEFLVIISGSVLFGFGEKADKTKAVEYGPGSYIYIPGKTPHWVWAKSELVFLQHYTGPADRHLVSEKANQK